MEHQRKLFQQRGYSEDLLPKTQSQRTWKTFNYFTLWMGSVHNVPNYVMVGGFFILGCTFFGVIDFFFNVDFFRLAGDHFDILVPSVVKSKLDTCF